MWRKFEKAGRCDISGEAVLVQSPEGSYRCPGCNRLLVYSRSQRTVDGYVVKVAVHRDATREAVAK